MILKYLPQPNVLTGFFVHLSNPAQTCSLGSCHMSVTIFELSFIYRTWPVAKNAKSKVKELFCLQETSWHHGILMPLLPCTMSTQAVSIQGQQPLKLSRKPVPVFDHPLSKKLFPRVQIEPLTCVHLVLSLKATKSLAPPSSFPPARCQDLPQVFSSPRLQVPALSASLIHGPVPELLHQYEGVQYSRWIISTEQRGRIISPHLLAKLWPLLPQGCTASSQSVY